MSTISNNGAYYRIYATGESFRDREEIREFYNATFTAFPDLHIEIKNLIQDVACKQVLLEYRFVATFKNPLWGLDPTNRQFFYDGAIVYEFDETGKLTKEIGYFDKAELLASMGIIRDTNTLLGKILLILPQNPLYFVKSALLNLFGKSSASKR
jgi:predicted ester cyclase